MTSFYHSSSNFAKFLRIAMLYEFLVFAVKQIWFSFMVSVFFFKIVRYTEALQFGYPYPKKKPELTNKINPEIMKTWHVCVMEFQTPNFWEFHEKFLSRNHFILFRTVFCWKYARSENIPSWILFVRPAYSMPLAIHYVAWSPQFRVFILSSKICTTFKVVQMEFQMKSNAASFR